MRRAQAQKVTSIDVTAYKCKECDYLSTRLLPECTACDHTISKVVVKRRAFLCGACKHHTTVLNKRFPAHACDKCGSSDWREASIRRERSAPMPGSEFLPRGEEVGRFRGCEPRGPLASLGHASSAAQRDAQ